MILNDKLEHVFLLQLQNVVFLIFFFMQSRRTMRGGSTIASDIWILHSVDNLTVDWSSYGTIVAMMVWNRYPVVISVVIPVVILKTMASTPNRKLQQKYIKYISNSFHNIFESSIRKCMERSNNDWNNDWNNY